MSTHCIVNARRLTAAAVLVLPLIGVAIAFGGTASAHQDTHLIPPEVSAARAEAIAEKRLPQCVVTDLRLYRDEDWPMWFVETECSDETWKDLRIDGVTGQVIAINGDYTV